MAEPMPLVVTLNVAEVAPAGTVIEDGTVAAVLLEFRLTEIPPARAG
jgi:hypothetical protein